MDADWSWWMLLGWTWMAVFWGLLIWGVVALVQRRDRGQATTGEDPVRILERRYARGDIEKPEFEEMRRTLHES